MLSILMEDHGVSNDLRKDSVRLIEVLCRFFLCTLSL